MRDLRQRETAYNNLGFKVVTVCLQTSDNVLHIFMILRSWESFSSHTACEHRLDLTPDGNIIFKLYHRF
jgi:hypothetical protein